MHNVKRYASTRLDFVIPTTSFTTWNYSVSLQIPRARWKLVDLILWTALCHGLIQFCKKKYKNTLCLNFKNIESLYFSFTVAYRKEILGLVSHILFKWTIFIGNRLSMVSATVNSMNGGSLFNLEAVLINLL